MRISDWSSDVCSSDLLDVLLGQLVDEARGDGGGPGAVHAPVGGEGDDDALARAGEADISEPALLLQAAPPGLVEGALVGEQALLPARPRSEGHTSALQSIMRITFAVF